MSSAKIKVSHILTKYEYECQDVLKKINSGQSFEFLAQKFSICPSAEQGGLLGVVSVQRLDSDFAEMALELKEGELGGPLRTRFGYHLIRREKL